MPRRGENIYRRKDGRWEARYICGRKQGGEARYKSVYASSYEKVKEKLKAVCKEQSCEKTPKAMTVEALCTQWLEDVKISLKPPSFAKYSNTVHTHIIPPFQGVKLRSITTSQVNAFIKEKSLFGRLDGKGGLSAKTVRDMATLFKEILQYAVKKGYLTAFDFDFTLPKNASKEVCVLTVSEQARLQSYIQRNLDIEKLGVLLCLYTGIRIGELCALKWKNVDFEANIITVRKTLQRISNVEENAKTKTIITIDKPKSSHSIRNIPLPSFLKKTLKKYKIRYHPEAYVLTGEISRFVEPRLYEKWFKKYLQESKIEDVKFHVLRHTFATRALEEGIDPKTLSEILGHSSTKFTMERYVHSSLELKKAGIEKLFAFY